jgi:DNA-binding PadR family transcriptional regulator
MGKHSIGEFEEIVMLTILILKDQAYGVAIKEDIESRVGRKVSLGAMRTALDRLESKGLLESEFGEATAVRGGKRKRFFQVTASGKKSLEGVRSVREKLWGAVPNYHLKPDSLS